VDSPRLDPHLILHGRYDALREMSRFARISGQEFGDREGVLKAVRKTFSVVNQEGGDR